MPTDRELHAVLQLEDGTEFEGISFGSHVSTSGEVVFNTGLVGYPESLSDPSYKGQVLVLTYPLIGNYGVPEGPADYGSPGELACGLDGPFESHEIQVSGLIVSDVCHEYSHWNASHSLSEWLKKYNVPALSGVDTRDLTKRLREKGTMLGKIIFGDGPVEQFDPDKHNLVARVSCNGVCTYNNAGKKRVVLIDCGCKSSIINSLVQRGVTVIRLPWDYDFTTIEYDGLLVSNGPGNPKRCEATIAHLRKAMEIGRPIFGICLGNQLMALAAGADTYKLKYGHRSQNQPSLKVGSRRCYITSQNHGYAVAEESLPPGWKPWFVNANDKTIEGIRHGELPYMAVQFHPEARPGPTDTRHLFDEFVGML